MTYESYRLVFTAALIVGFIFTAIATLIFIRLKINEVFGFLTGTTARKAIAGISFLNSRKDGASSGKSTQRAIGDPTAFMTPSGRLISQNQDSGINITEKLSTARLVYTDDSTDDLDLKEDVTMPVGVSSNNVFIIEKEIISVHTDERITG